MTTAEKLVKLAENRVKLILTGVSSMYNELWDAIQDNGQRRDYRQGFAGSGWTDIIFMPKYDIIVEGNASNMFWGSKITDMVACLERNNVTIDTSRATDLSYAFSCNSLYLPEISAVSATNIGVLFGYDRSLISVKKLILKNDGSQTFNNVFYNCTGLEEIEIEGVIGNDFDIRYSTKLSHKSLQFIINALKDYSGSGTTHTLRIGGDNIAKLTQDEISSIEAKGWSLQ